MKTLAAIATFLLAIAAIPHLSADEQDADSGSLRSPLAEELNAAASRALNKKHELKYKFADDE